MWFRNLIVYTLPGTLPLSAEELGPLLAPQAFISGGRLEALRVGWAPPQPDDPALVCAVGGQLLLSLRQEKKLLPARVITQTVAERARLIEAEEGFKPGRKRLRELKDQVRDELLPRAFSLSSDTRVWIDPAARRLAVEAVSAARAADLVLVPTRVSAFDLHAIKTTGELMRIAQKPAYTIFNAVPPRAAALVEDAAAVVRGICST